jgi:hypothetical protein
LSTHAAPCPGEIGLKADYRYLDGMGDLIQKGRLDEEAGLERENPYSSSHDRILQPAVGIHLEERADP